MTDEQELDLMFLTYPEAEEVPRYLMRICRICGAMAAIPELHRTYHEAEKR